jgi:hypothetical protein
MKKTIQNLCILLFSTMTLISCSLFKSEDKKISESLVGTFEEETEVADEKYKWEFEENGNFKLIAYMEVAVYPTLPNYKSKKTLILTGTWEVKDKKLTMKFDKAKDEKGYEFSQELVEKYTTRLKNMEVTSYDDKKIMLKDKDGDKHTLTKSKD